VFPRGARGYIAERKRLRYFPALVRAVPELREHLTLRCFLSRRTATFDLALAGAALTAARRSPAWLVLALPYCRVVGPPAPVRRATLRRFAADVTADAVGLVALLRGSAGARTVVL
jgi:hypothetical protein